jgi:glycosyltransferase involved in cell wall biosynthesis
MAINVLYISYWGANEGITMATIIPHLKILSAMPEIEQIVFCSIERNESEFTFKYNKIKHVPLLSKKLRSTILTKVGDFITFQKKLSTICESIAIDRIICRSALAGIFGYRLWKKFNIPYIVESFEPHAEYMIEAHVWRKFGLRSLIQKRAERLQIKTASFLFPVSSNYQQKLINRGVAAQRIITVPCCVSLDQFQFNQGLRSEMRKRLGISDHGVAGIYIGKYGDIYHSTDAYDLYRDAFDFFKDKFHLIILTPDNQSKLELELSSRNIPMQKVFIGKVPHDEIPGYLSAADFAFSTIKPSPSRIYCSPIKNGEYWANGLPILTEPGIGEDSRIILEEGGGVLLDINNPYSSFELLASKYLQHERVHLADGIKEIALRHRHFDLVRQAYKKIIL